LVICPASTPRNNKAAAYSAENKTFQDIAAETVAYYTKVLAWFTGVLAVSTIGLWGATYLTLRHAEKNG